MTLNMKREKDTYNMTVSFTPDEWNAKVNEAYSTTASRFKVVGFRPGKAPRGIIEKNYGADVFFEEALNRAIAQLFKELGDNHPEVKPVDHLSVKNISRENGVEIVCSLDVEPEFTLGKYTGFEVPRVKQTIGVKEVEAFLKKEAEQRSRMVAADGGHAAAAGDTAVIDFVGSVNGVPFEGGTGKGYELEIGSKSFIDTFEDQLVGHKIGEEIVVNVRFPKKYHAPELENKEATFIVNIKNILIKQVPAIDDKFAREASEFNTLEEYRKNIKEKMQKQADDKSEDESKNALLKKVVEGTSVKIPEKMAERQLDDIMRDMEMRLFVQGLDLETYAKYMKTTVEDLRRQQKKAAEGIAKTRLVYDAIIEKENITASAEAVSEQVAKFAKRSGKREKELTSDKETMRYIEHNAKMDTLLNFLLSKNKIV